MITDVIEDAFAATGYTADDIDWFVPHQANKRIIDDSAQKLGIAPEKVVTTVDRHGNTSAASIPLALDGRGRGRPHQARRSGPARSDGRRLHLGVGAGALVSVAAQIFPSGPVDRPGRPNIVDNSARYLDRRRRGWR